MAPYTCDFLDFPPMTLIFVVIEGRDLIRNLLSSSRVSANGIELVGAAVSERFTFMKEQTQPLALANVEGRSVRTKEHINVETPLRR